MTEEEKIFAGKLFNNQCDALKAIKVKTHAANQRYNALLETDPERETIIREMMGRVGNTFRFVGPIYINYGTHTFIGDNVCIGPNVSLLATNHPLIAQERMGMDAEGNTTLAEYADEIHIGNNVWIAANVCVIGGVTIGDGAVIGAGSVVTRDIPPNSLAVGVPCRVLREITEADTAAERLLPEDRDYFKNNFGGF